MDSEETKKALIGNPLKEQAMEKPQRKALEDAIQEPEQKSIAAREEGLMSLHVLPSQQELEFLRKHGILQRLIQD